MKKLFSTFIWMVVLALFVCSCRTQKQYVVIRSPEISYANFNGPQVNYIPLSTPDLERYPFLDSVCGLIQLEEYSALQRIIDNKLQAGRRTPDVYLAKTLLLITKRDYVGARGVLPLTEGAFPQLTALLSIDVGVEIQRKNFPAKPVNNFFAEYQALADKYPNDKTLKAIIVIRIRFLQYLI